MVDFPVCSASSSSPHPSTLPCSSLNPSFEKKRLRRWIWLLASCGNTPSPWQESTMATANLFKTVSHIWSRQCWGSLLVLSRLPITLWEATLEQQLPDQASWRQTVSQCLLEPGRAKETKRAADHFAGNSECPFTISSLCLCLQCVLPVSSKNSHAPSLMPVKTVSKHPLNESTEHPTNPPQSCPSARGEGCGLPQSAEWTVKVWCTV